MLVRPLLPGVMTICTNTYCHQRPCWVHEECVTRAQGGYYLLFRIGAMPVSAGVHGREEASLVPPTPHPRLSRAKPSRAMFKISLFYALCSAISLLHSIDITRIYVYIHTCGYKFLYIHILFGVALDCIISKNRHILNTTSYYVKHSKM